MTDRRDNTRFKWWLIALTGLLSLAMILGTVQEIAS